MLKVCLLFSLLLSPVLLGQPTEAPNQWEMKMGENLHSAAFDSNDEGWMEVAGDGGWPSGPAWFRMFLTMDPNLKTPAVVLGLKARVRVYWNGQLLDPIGPGGFNPTNYVYVLESSEPGTTGILAVQYMGPYSGDPTFVTRSFRLRLKQGNLDDLILQRAEFEAEHIFHKAFLIGICLAFCLLHLLLFLFYPELRANLYYAGLTFGIGFMVWVFLSIFMEPDLDVWLAYQRLTTLSLALPLLFGLRFTYALTYEKCPRFFWPLVVPFVLMSIWGWFQPFLVFEINGSLVVIAFAEITRVLIVSRAKKRTPLIRGVPIIAVGAVPAMLAILYELALLNLPMKPFLDFLGVPLFFYASVPLMISVSVFLARHFAITNRNLTSQLEQVRELSEKTLAQELERARLEADNERKNKELEEARKLQLSMLPDQAPELDRYEIAFYMQTATEVGGDYYDFHMEDTGLTLVIGDATGHGMRAGAMVAAGKGAFHAYSGFHPGQLLGKMCGALKKMNLKGMFMAMCAVKLYENKAILANAGMPGAILYRSQNKTLEVIGGQGPPLGSLAFFPYRETELILEGGDLIVFQSDGLPERFNKEDELFGMDSVLEVIQQLNEASPKQLIEALVQRGERWSDGRPLDDDMTFVVIKRL